MGPSLLVRFLPGSRVKVELFVVLLVVGGLGGGGATSSLGEGGKGLLAGLSPGLGSGGGGRVGPPLASEPLLLVSDRPRARFLVSATRLFVLPSVDSSWMPSSSSSVVVSSSSPGGGTGATLARLLGKGTTTCLGLSFSAARACCTASCRT